MRILDEAQSLGTPPEPVCLAIGVFDGVHLGHVQVIRQMLADARKDRCSSVVVTFDRHPNAVVAPERTPPMIYPLWKRLDTVARLGVEAALVFQFDHAFSRQSGSDFVERLLRGFGRFCSLSVGTGFVFGHRRSGDLQLLRSLGEKQGFAVHGIAPVEAMGEVISSTRVRECIAAGDFERATALLGRPYRLAGTVAVGDQLGRGLGFPTANLNVDGLVLPPPGVYAATAIGEDFRSVAAVNVGRRPTVRSAAAAIRVEAHLLGFDGDLYGRRMELEMGGRLRGEVRFPSREALADQIRRDVDQVREWAGNKGLL
jgi:riboflavin kinase/FMN adenylyltransferase